MKRILTIIAAVAFSAIGLAGTASATPYPTTTIDEQLPPEETTTTSPPPVVLPPTGSNIDQTLLIGGSIVVVGTGLVIGVRQRRRTAEA